MKTKIPENGDRWVNCPVCGEKIMRARIASCDQRCKNCGRVIMICATRRFVTTIVHDENENVSTIERLHKYQEELLGLAL